MMMDEQDQGSPSNRRGGRRGGEGESRSSRATTYLVFAGAFGLLHLSDLEWFSVDRQLAHSHREMPWFKLCCYLMWQHCC